jgi:hypothetical protein
VHQRSAIHVELPIKDREVGLYRRRVGKHGRQAAIKRARSLLTFRSTGPDVVECRLGGVAVDRAANDNVGVVQLEKLAVLCLNLVGAFVGPKVLDVLSGRVENRV